MIDLPTIECNYPPTNVHIERYVDPKTHEIKLYPADELIYWVVQDNGRDNPKIIFKAKYLQSAEETVEYILSFADFPMNSYKYDIVEHKTDCNSPRF